MKKSSTHNHVLPGLRSGFLSLKCFGGKTHTRLEDLIGTYRIANCKTFYKIIDYKLDLLLACRRSWPTYASFDKDKLFRKNKWNEKYKDVRVVMWDDTNILVHKIKKSLTHLIIP